jgi:bifunctional lysine-specific demethylase and histidyl-hydroxylase NO66
LSHALARCVDPWSVEQFLAERWQQAPLLLKRDRPDHFRDLISLTEFDAIVAHTGLRHPYFRLFKDGTPIPVSAATTARQLGPDLDTGLADLGVIYDEYGDGATIVLQALERWWPRFQRLCREFEVTLGHPTQAHAYLTPASARGAPVHYDTHDVFVLQVEGAKTWRVWQPLKSLPMRLSEDTYEPEAVAAHVKEHEPLIDVELGAGDSLYLPRGYVHDVVADRERSLHVTLSVMVYRWADLAEAVVVRRLAELADVESFRESIPFGRAPLTAAGPAMRDRYLQLATDLLRGLDFDGGLDLMRSRMISYAVPSFRGRLLDLHRAEIELDQQVFVKDDAMSWLSDGGEKATLLVGASVVTFDRRFLPALRHVTSSDSFRPKELPGGLAADDQLALARRLVEAGLCTLGREGRR